MFISKFVQSGLFDLFAFFLVFFAISVYGDTDAGKLHLAKRFIDREHWNEALLRLKAPDGRKLDSENIQNELFELYGLPAMEAWISAINFASTKSTKHLPGLEDLREVHRRVYDFKGNSFTTYYRIKGRYPIGGNLNLQIQSWARKGLFSALETRFGIKIPLGELRDGDVYSMSNNFGSPHREKGVSVEQRDRLKRNSYLRIKSETLLPDGKWKIQFAYPDGSQVRDLTEQTFEKMHRQVVALNGPESTLQRNTPEFEHRAIEIAAEFYQSLISIHPMWDGVGRTSKILRDWVLSYLDVPPPADTPSNDLELTQSELVSDMKKAIQETRLKTESSAPAPLSSGCIARFVGVGQ